VAAARDILEERGIRVGIVVLEQLKPLGAVARTVAELTRGARRILFAEEGIRAGGAAMLLCDELMRLGVDVSGGRYLISAVNDDFASPTEPCDIYEFAGLDPRTLADKITESN
jgi:transketolase C-terminal domain/subunit